MEDALVIETERVEKITSTSSRQQVAVDDRSLGNVYEESKSRDLTRSNDSESNELCYSGTPAESDAVKQQCDEPSGNGSIQEAIAEVHTVNILTDNTQLAVSGDIQDTNLDSSFQSGTQNVVDGDQYCHETESPQHIANDSYIKCNAVLNDNGPSANGNAEELLISSVTPAEVESTTPAAFVSTVSTDKVTSHDEQTAVVSNEFSDKLESGPVSETVPGAQSQQENSEVFGQKESTSNLDNMKMFETANDSDSMNQNSRTANDEETLNESSNVETSNNKFSLNESSNVETSNNEVTLNLDKTELTETTNDRLNLKQVETTNDDYSLNLNSETPNDEVSLSLDTIKHAETTIEEPLVVMASVNGNSYVHSEISNHSSLFGGELTSDENKEKNYPVDSEPHEDQNDNLADTNKCNRAVNVVANACETTVDTKESTSNLFNADNTCQHAAALFHGELTIN